MFNIKKVDATMEIRILILNSISKKYDLGKFYELPNDTVAFDGTTEEAMVIIGDYHEIFKK